MRRNLIVSALENLAYNLRYLDRLAVFEIGRTYRPQPAAGGDSGGEISDSKLPEEERRLCIALRGLRDAQRTSAASEPAQNESELF